jgi:hypothetical protein
VARLQQEVTLREEKARVVRNERRASREKLQRSRNWKGAFKRAEPLSGNNGRRFHEEHAEVHEETTVQPNHHAIGELR